ncbi:MAG: ATP-binding cassette domain-containing protein [Orrella sp.]
MIRADHLTIRRGTKVLFEDAEFMVHAGERVGLVGRNGSGKSSLFAVIKGQVDIDAGDITYPDSWRLAWVEQMIDNMDRPAREHVIDGDRLLRDLQAQRALAETESVSGETIAELEGALDQAGAWQANARAESLLAGLGFSADQWMAPVGSFSGGWQMRISLARALMAPSDLLLLDEPTNHLDLDAMLWLERWLASYEGTAIIISHDTEFLDAVSQVILHVDHKKLVRYKGGYESFLSQRAERLRQTRLAWEKQTQETARMQQFIDRFKAKASKAKQAQSRVKALARMQTLAPLHAEANIDIRIPQPDNTPDTMVRLKDASVGYELDGQWRVILSEISQRVEAGDRIGVLGVNGAGKSTLIKLIAGELESITGERSAAKTLKIGYFAQHQMDVLDAKATPLLHLARIAPNIREQQQRNYLAQFGFTGDRVNEPIAPFSGGEKARLALALVVWHKPNLLVLDEPSNHLDVETREALTTALAEYEGSLLLVSHDRHLLRTTVDKFWLVANGQALVFDGDLDDYRQMANSSGSSKGGGRSNQNVDRKQQRREQAQARQQIANAKKPLEKKLANIDSRMAAVQKKLETLETQLADESLYADSEANARQDVLEQHAKLAQEKSRLEEDWLGIMGEIEALSQPAQAEAK